MSIGLSLALALEFLIRLSQEPNANVANVAFSPASLTTAFGMLLQGARGPTADQIIHALHLDKSKDIHQDLSELSAIRSDSLRIANKAFVNANYKLLDSYLQDIREKYGAQAENMNFGSQAAKSLKTINAWVSDKTAGMIPDLLADGAISEDTALYLINVLYFKESWQTPFNPAETRRGLFYASKEKTMEVEMMHRNANFRINYDQKLGVRTLELPYAGGELSFVIILPTHRWELDKVLSGLDVEALGKLLDSAYNMQANLYLPRFKVTAETNVKELLMAAGVKDVFARGQADLSGIDGSHNLYVSDIMHKVVVQVNEQGTEAAAATGIGISTMSLPLHFEVNEPFLFFIRYPATKSILFVGRINNP